MTKLTTSNPARAAMLVAALAAAGSLGVAAAQTAPAQKSVVTIPANVLSVSEIENRLSTQGIKVREIEVRDLLAEVEGYDADGREIEVVVDRRNGEILSHEFDR